MAKFDNATVVRWTEMVDSWFSKNFGVTDRAGITHRTHVTDGSSAWTIAHRSGVTDVAYADRSVTDAHIVSALKKIFPNAVFKDRYTY